MASKFLVFLTLGVFSASSSAYGFVGAIWDYVSQYQIGVEYSASTDNVAMKYKMNRSGGIPASCEADINDSTKQFCTHDIVGGQSSGFGLFLQQAFQRKGDFHLDFDLSLGVRYLEGAIDDAELTSIQNQGLLLTEASFALAVGVVKPYMEIGYTPTSGFPDIIFRLGPVAQLGVGSFSINDNKENVAIAVSSGVTGYFETEVVFVRFGDGAFSVYASGDAAGRDGTPLYPNAVDGMDDFTGTFSRNISGPFGYGLKLVLNWP